MEMKVGHVLDTRIRPICPWDGAGEVVEACKKSGSGLSDQLETNDPVDASYSLQDTVVP